MDNILKTFSDSYRGKRNAKMDAIMDEFKDEIQPILDKFINKCARENIEYYSINGALYDALSEVILSARLQVLQDLSGTGIIID